MHRPALLAATALVCATAAPRAPAPRPGADLVVLIDAAVLDSMNAVFARSTREWRRYPNNVNPINYGAGSSGWQETLRCLRGTAARDTVRVRGWAAARGTRALASAVTGDCSGVADALGTWHTHPWRADSTGRPVKVPGLSAGDLRTFRAGQDAVALVQWDGDSLAATARGPDGTPRYPAAIVHGARAVR